MFLRHIPACTPGRCARRCRSVPDMPDDLQGHAVHCQGHVPGAGQFDERLRVHGTHRLQLCRGGCQLHRVVGDGVGEWGAGQLDLDLPDGVGRPDALGGDPGACGYIIVPVRRVAENQPAGSAEPVVYGAEVFVVKDTQGYGDAVCVPLRVDTQQGRYPAWNGQGLGLLLRLWMGYQCPPSSAPTSVFVTPL